MSCLFSNCRMNYPRYEELSRTNYQRIDAHLLYYPPPEGSVPGTKGVLRVTVPYLRRFNPNRPNPFYKESIQYHVYELNKWTNASNAQTNIDLLFDQCIKDGYLIGDIGLKQIYNYQLLVTCSKFAKIRDYPLDEIFF